MWKNHQQMWKSSIATIHFRQKYKSILILGVEKSIIEEICQSEHTNHTRVTALELTGSALVSPQKLGEQCSSAAAQKAALGSLSSLQHPSTKEG